VSSARVKFSPHSRFREIRKELRKLLSKKPYKVGEFVDNGVFKNHPEHGIYVFTDPEDKTIVYIGISHKHKRGVGGRARHHERLGHSLQRKLGVNQQTFRNCNVRVHPIKDPSVRAVTEIYGIAVYGPKGNRPLLEDGSLRVDI
jgi:hypothetical protein